MEYGGEQGWYREENRVGVEKNILGVEKNRVEL